MTLPHAAVYHPHAFCVLYKAGYADPADVVRDGARFLGLTAREATRTDVLDDAIRHVLRYGRLGKQSERRLRAALKAVEVSRG